MKDHRQSNPTTQERIERGLPPRKNGPSRTLIPIGTRFGRLIVVAIVHGPRSMWTCRCDCGTIKNINYSGLKTGNTTSCGCFRLDRLREACFKHGLTGTPIYICWMNMKARCTNPDFINYADYGGRGIRVCDRWLSSFSNFLADMGERPNTDSTIEREDVNGNYEPGNCVWLPRRLQNRNKTNNHIVEHLGISLPIAEWAEYAGIDYFTLHSRITRYGWSVADALTIPVGGQR